MTMDPNELNQNDMEQASGGSLFNREDSIRNAGIELWKEYGKVPGEFGNIWNTGDYYFNGQKIGQGDVNVLEKYYDKYHEVAPSLEEARAKCGKKKKTTFGVPLR